MLLFIHKRKSSMQAGTVTDASGLILGRVFPCSKIAAGTRGQRRRFYTAEACYPGHAAIRCAPSLGTRYPTRMAAANALRDFATTYPREALNGKAALLAVDSGNLGWKGADDATWRFNRALSWAVNRWRIEHGIVSGRAFPTRVAA
jgi:hypothetical protein